jgi:predicted TIM-barrel fold metal-dependent hydrolase
MTNGADYRMGNDFLLGCVRLLPERLIPFAHFNPKEKRASLLAELQRMVDANVRAIKLINAYQAYAGDGPSLMALYEFAQRHRMIVVNTIGPNRSCVQSPRGTRS